MFQWIQLHDAVGTYAPAKRKWFQIQVHCARRHVAWSKEIIQATNASIFIHHHLSPSIFILYYPFSYVLSAWTQFRPFSSITIHLYPSPHHPFSYIYIHFHSHTSITVHFHPSKHCCSYFSTENIIHTENIYLWRFRFLWSVPRIKLFLITALDDNCRLV